MRLKTQAPTRIDLAGATLDIYPLYLFADGGLTLNAAVDLYTQAEIRACEGARVKVTAQDLDLGAEGECVDDLWEKARGGPLDLICRILRYYAPQGGVEILTSSNVPPGSGLGGSSSLLVALSTALVQWLNLPRSKTEIIDLGAQLEAQSIGIPTGKQDYFAAAFGGFSALHFGIGEARREEMRFSGEFHELLQQRVVLGYSGRSRFSADSNWDVFRRFVSRDPATVEAMIGIRDNARQMRRCLLDGDADALAPLLEREWQNHRRLSEGVSTAELEALFEAARAAGAMACKVCGAGGGGCFIAFSDGNRRPAVEDAIRSNGGSVLEFRFVPNGVQVVDWER